ncbi:MAG: efflux RND transporter permease subunit [Methyloligellaceae bacterium]
MVPNANDLPALSIRRPYFIIVVNLLIILAGVSAILGVEVRELPNIDRPIVSVRANYPGGSPETIDAEITSRIEGAVARVNGIRSVRSSSEENNLRVHIEFNANVDLIDAANDVREAVSRVARDLPDGVENITVIKADDDARAIIQLSAYSETLSIDKVTKIVEDQVIPELTAATGVADVQIFGARKKVLKVALNPIKLAGYKLTVSDVVAVLKNARYDVPAGSFKSQELEVLVRANASVHKPEDIENLIIKNPIKIGDVAQAYYTPADPENYTRLNGRTVINLDIVRRAQSNTVAISQEVKKIVERLNTRLRDVKLVTISDDSQFIEGAIREVLLSMMIAIMIVVAVIAIFIGSLRVAMIPAVAMPVALIGTVAAIWGLGFSINLITLLALVLATGLVVDDAIVVLENIQRLRMQGMASRAAAIIGTRQVFFAVIATTITLISVFIPISFLPTTAGRLFTEFGFVLAVTVSISSFVALTICPMMASRMKDLEASPSPSNPFALIGSEANRLYAFLLDRVLALPLIFVGFCLLVVFGAYLSYQNLAEELVPEEDRGLVTVRLVGPDGTGLNYADRQVEAVEQFLQPYKDSGVIKNISSISGRWDPNRGYISAPLSDWSERDISQSEIINQLNRKLGTIPGSRARISKGNSLNLRNADGGIRFAITGPNYDLLDTVSKAFAGKMEQDTPQVTNIRIEYRATQPQVDISINRRRAADLGVSIENLASTIKVLVDNEEVSELTFDDQTVPIIVEAGRGAIRSPSDLTNLYVRASNDRLVPLSQLITFREYAVAAELDRHAQRRAIEIHMDQAEGYTLKQAIAALRNLADKELPVGVGIKFLGAAADLEETSSDMNWTFAIAFLVIFLVLVAQFENIVSALIVMFIVPFGICAAIFALTLTGTTINVYSQIGILMLIGIMAKNSILMVEFADQLREEGKNVYEAVREASLIRVRPIVMTMVSTILAGLPLILGSGPGAESRAAIGWVVFGGLGLAATFTLFLTPAIYLLVAGFFRPRNADDKGIEKELQEAVPQ